MNGILDNYLFEAFSNASDNIYVYVTDMKTNITRWSDNAVAFFNLQNEYTENTAEMWLDYIHPDDRELYTQDIMNVMNGISAHHNCQYRARNRYGEYVWVECRGSISVDSNGALAVFAGIMTRLDNQNKYDNLTHLLTSYELLRNPFNESGTLMLIGIDYFRDINSQHGILYGNKVLARLSNILVRESRENVVYRFQGDEFVIYGKNMSAQDMVVMFRRIQMACNESERDAGLINFTVSAGITGFSCNNEAAEVLARAELTLNYAKEMSATHISVFSPEIEAKQSRRNKVSEELIRCIKNDFQGFYLVYQPIFDNAGEKLVACESLLRWDCDDEIGQCCPNEFIPLLERNGGIVDIGYFVMREAIRQAAEWQKKYKKFCVSFNVSYMQLEDAEFIPSVIETVEKYGVDPSRIVIELTESILAADPIMVNNSFEILRKYGIQTALDDFGTGSSSFWTLHKINVDIVKLDQAFIRGLGPDETDIDYAIVESVRLMCDRIGFKAIAEGVETEAIWEKLKQFHFNGLQGYYFSRPIACEAFEELLQKYDMIK